jgi:peptide/nickel transport system substrate-binding protein
VAVINELTRQWAEVGVRAVPHTAGVAGLVQGFLLPREYDAVFYDFRQLPRDPDPYPQWHSTQNMGDGQNLTGYSSERADLIMEEARRTTDAQRRASLYREVQRILAEDVAVLPLYYPVYTYAIDERVKGVRLGPLWDTPDRFRTITDWYAATRRTIRSEAPFLERNPG